RRSLPGGRGSSAMTSAPPLAAPLRGRTPGVRVGEAAVLLGCGAEPLAAVGVPGGAGPVGGDALTVDQDKVGHLPAAPAKGRALGRDRQPLGASAEGGGRGPPGCWLVHRGSPDAGAARSGAGR